MTKMADSMSIVGSQQWPRRLGAALQGVAMVALLACIASRCFLMELPFAGPAGPGASVVQLSGSEDLGPIGPDRSEIARVTYALVLLGAGAVWLIGSAITGRLVLRAWPLALLILGFAGWSLVAAMGASDKRAALNGWLEQLSLLTAGLLAAQVFADKRRFRLLLVVLAGVAGALVVKGLWQLTAEIPERIASFGAHRDQWLDRFGWAAGTPQAKLIESRLREVSVTGFFGLANLFASLMILLTAAAAGLAVEKLASAGASRKAPRPDRKPGEIHLPTLAGILTACLAAGAGAMGLLTRSRGAIGAAALAAAATVCVYLLGRRLATHWRRCLIAAWVVFLLAAGGVVTFGLARDRLPTKTMTFRWYYWTASAKIVAEKPIFGVGPGNFPSAYLKHRRAAAEEEIKMPHNAIVHAAAQYGLGGGAIYMGILVFFLVGAVRPRRRREGEEEVAPPQPTTSARKTAAILGAIVLAVLAGRYIFGGVGDKDAVASLLLEVISPAVVLAGCFVLAGWWGGRSAGDSRVSSLGRVALAAGVVAFALHNMVSFSLWVPGTALVFWSAAGACLARAGGKVRTFRTARWPVATIAVAGVVVAVALLWKPVQARTAMAEAMLKPDIPFPGITAPMVANMDPLDARSAARAAMAEAGVARVGGPPIWIVRAYNWALEAIHRDPAKWAHHRLAAALAERYSKRRGAGATTEPAVDEPAGPTTEDALGHMKRAVELNPMEARLRIEYAEMLLRADRFGQCLIQLAAAEDIDSQLFPESVKKLNADERGRIRRARESCQAGLA